MEFDGKQIGVIHIPQQKRPFYSRVNYGVVAKNIVYVRRGSSTAPAMPDEIASMGADQISQIAPEPILSLSLWNASNGEPLGTNIEIGSVAVSCPPKESISDYSEKKNGFEIGTHFVNHDYHREVAQYLTFHLLLNEFTFQVTNVGNVTAPGVRCVFEVPDRNHRLLFMQERKRPKPPRRRNDLIEHIRPPNIHSQLTNDCVTVSKIGDTWRVECVFHAMVNRVSTGS